MTVTGPRHSAAIVVGDKGWLAWACGRDPDGLHGLDGDQAVRRVTTGGTLLCGCRAGAVFTRYDGVFGVIPIGRRWFSARRSAVARRKRGIPIPIGTLDA
jgi:hypothetical protein